MNTLWQIKNRVWILGRVWALACLSVIPLSAEEPYVHWVTTVPGGVGSLVMTGDGGLVSYRWDGAVHKLNPQGELELVSSNALVGPIQATLHGVTTDALGNHYWIGQVVTNGIFDFPAVRGFYVAKFGPTNNLLWVRNNEIPEDNENFTSPEKISVDSVGNIAVGGTSTGRLKLGSFESDGEISPFFCKYDANGNLLWARRVASQITSPWPGAYCYDIALDGSGNVIACGRLTEGSSDFGGTTVYPGTVHGYGGDWFMAKYSPSGELLWVTLDYANAQAVDKHGDIYVAFEWPLQGMRGIAKLNGNGDLLWKTNLPIYWMGPIALDEQEQPVFTGGFEGTVQLGANALRSRGSFDFFVAKADVDGNVLWAIAGGGPWGDHPSRLASDSAGNVLLVAGISSGPGSFDGISIVPSPPEASDITVVARLSERPPVKMARSAGGVQLSWPAKATNYVLEAATNLTPGSAWNPVTNAPAVTATNRSVQLPLTGPAKFFRLRKP